MPGNLAGPRVIKLPDANAGLRDDPLPRQISRRPDLERKRIVAGPFVTAGPFIPEKIKMKTTGHSVELQHLI